VSEFVGELFHDVILSGGKAGARDLTSVRSASVANRIIAHSLILGGTGI